MSFTLQDIESINAGDNYPEFVRQLKKIGVLSYIYNLKDGVITYYGNDDHHVKTNPKSLNLSFADEISPDAVKDVVDKHQQGELDFSGFCQEMAKVGIYSWEANLEHLQVEYKNNEGRILLREQIPTFAD